MRIIEILFSAIMEGFFIVGAGLSVIGIRPKLYKIAFIGAVCGLFAYGVRLVYETSSIALGAHSFILIVLYIAILRWVGRQNWASAIIAPLISFFLINIGEGIILFNVVKLFDISISDILNKPGFRLIGTILTDIPLIIVFIMGYILNISLIDINCLPEKEDI